MQRALLFKKLYRFLNMSEKMKKMSRIFQENQSKVENYKRNNN